jgi:hypothetical protein
VIELEDRRLAPLGGRRSERSLELKDTLLTLLRHAEATNTERDGEPAARQRSATTGATSRGRKQQEEVL